MYVEDDVVILTPHPDVCIEFARCNSGRRWPAVSTFDRTSSGGADFGSPGIDNCNLSGAIDCSDAVRCRCLSGVYALHAQGEQCTGRHRASRCSSDGRRNSGELVNRHPDADDSELAGLLANLPGARIAVSAEEVLKAGTFPARQPERQILRVLRSGFYTRSSETCVASRSIC